MLEKREMAYQQRCRPDLARIVVMHLRKGRSYERGVRREKWGPPMWAANHNLVVSFIEGYRDKVSAKS